MVADDYREFGTKILMPLARNMPLNQWELVCFLW